MNYVDYFGITDDLNILIVTDDRQINLAEVFKCLPSKSLSIVKVYDDLGFYDCDMLIVILSFDSFVIKGFNKRFSPFRKPKGYEGKYVFVRLDISQKSLKEGLESSKDRIIETLNKYQLIKNKALLLTSQAGTHIRFKVNEFKTCQHFIDDVSDMAFLPPSEIYAGIELGSANGCIVIDLTIGDIYSNGQLLDGFGLVEEPVRLLVENSKIVDVIGHDRLKTRLKALEKNASVLVELGIGLSSMTPTGQVGIDECISGTCHFGIGDGTFYGIDNQASIHLDVVIEKPFIEEIEL